MVVEGETTSGEISFCQHFIILFSESFAIHREIFKFKYQK